MCAVTTNPNNRESAVAASFCRCAPNITSPWGRGAKQILDFLLEIRPGVKVDEVALLIHQPHGRYTADAVLLGEAVAPALAIKELRPRHVFLFNEPLEGALLGVERDTDNLESFRIQFLLGLLDAWQLGDAGTAPCGPKIVQHNLALHLGEIDLGAVHRSELHVERLADSVVRLLLG